MDICDALRRCFRDLIHKHALCVSAPAAFEALLPPTVPTMSCAPALPCVDNPRVRSARDVPAAPAASPLGQTLPDLRGIAQQVRAHTPCPRKRVVGDMAHLLLVLRAPARTPRPRKRVVGGGARRQTPNVSASSERPTPCGGAFATEGAGSNGASGRRAGVHTFAAKQKARESTLRYEDICGNT